MCRPFISLLALLLGMGMAIVVAADAPPIIKCPSPNGRFALRMTEPAGGAVEDQKVEVIEKASGKVLCTLDSGYYSNPDETVLVWSADSKRVAYGTRGPKMGDVGAYFWTGSAFEPAKMPERLPDPEINFGKVAGAGVKNYGGAAKPLRWLKSGELEVANEAMMMSHANDKSYTGVVVFTLAFDKQHRASVHNVGKSKTRVE